MTNIEYTQTGATEEALRLFARKVHRLHPGAYADVIRLLPEGAREALQQAEMRADTLMHHDQRDGVTRTYPSVFDDIDEE